MITRNFFLIFFLASLIIVFSIIIEIRKKIIFNQAVNCTLKEELNKKDGTLEKKLEFFIAGHVYGNKKNSNYLMYKKFLNILDKTQDVSFIIFTVMFFTKLKKKI